MVWVPLETLIDTAYRRVCPLYSFDRRGRVHLTATAVPFRSGRLRFLITAAHACFRDGKPIPLFVHGKKRGHPLVELRGAWEYRRGVDPDIDLAVIALADDCADDLELHHWFSTPSDVSQVKPKTPGVHYMIAGYPFSRNRTRPVRYGLPSRATALITGDICSVDLVRGVDKSDEHHFALYFPHKKIPRAGGGTFHVPKPTGMSGGGIWRVDIDLEDNMADSPVLVGIGVEYHKAEKAFISTRIQAVIPLAWDLADPDTATVVA